jgi:hypothetical protein
MDVSIDVSGGCYSNEVIPDCSLIHDNGCINIQFGEVTLVLNYHQFFEFIEKANAWQGTVGSGDTCDLNAEAVKPTPAEEERPLCGTDALRAAVDTDRLVWLMRNLTGKELRRIGVVYSDASLEPFREAIDVPRLKECGNTPMKEQFR